MNDDIAVNAAETRIGCRWFVAALASTAVGVLAAVPYVGLWFTHAGWSFVFGIVYWPGVVTIGGWLVGLAIGMSLAVLCFATKSKVVILGAIICVVINLGMVLISGKAVYDFLKADFSLKSTEHLMQLLSGGNMDDRKLAALELGECKAAAAVVALCEILEEKQGLSTSGPMLSSLSARSGSHPCSPMLMLTAH